MQFFKYLFQGELTISADMEDLQNYLFMESVPPSWTKHAYPSTLGLSSWFADMLNRITELSNWTVDFNVSRSKLNTIIYNTQSSKMLHAKLKFITRISVIRSPAKREKEDEISRLTRKTLEFCHLLCANI